MSAIPTDRYLVLIGNPGAGKSWLLNKLYGQPVFESGLGVSGVTKELELIKMIDPNDHQPVYLANIPGLMENDAEMIERNKRELKHALSKGGQYKLIFIFAAGVGGRLQSMDVHAYKEFCKGYNLAKLPIIANNASVGEIRKEETKEAKLEKYAGTLKVQLKKLEIDTEVQVIEQNSPVEDIFTKVYLACESFPWQTMPVPTEMNFDENNKATQQAIRDYEKRIQELMKRMNEMAEAKAEAEQEARGMRDRLHQCEGRIGELQNQVNNSDGVKFCAIM